MNSFLRFAAVLGSCAIFPTATLAAQLTAAQRPLGSRLNTLGLPIGSVKLPDCPQFAPPQTAVRIWIPAGFVTATDDRNVRVSTDEASNRNRDDFDVYDNTPFDTVKDKSGNQEFNVNPYHLDLDVPSLHNSTDSYIKVRVILEPRKFEFDEDYDGVVVPEAAAKALLFCQIRNDLSDPPVKKSVRTGGGGRRSLLTFYALNGMQPWDSYANFVIIARQKKVTTDPSTSGGFNTPILIDPRVKNDG